MIRTLILLAVITIALTLMRALLRHVINVVSKVLSDPSSPSGQSSRAGFSQQANAGSGRSGREKTRRGHLVRDPVSGAYIDEDLAVKETINGRTFYFESQENRDRYLRETQRA